MNQDTNSRSKTDEPTLDHMSGSIVDAILSASEEISTRETWAPRGRGVFPVLAPRLISLMINGVRRLDPNGPPAMTVRQNVIRIMAYMDPDLRIAMLLDLSARKPEVVDDLFSGKVDGNFEIYRYNLFSTLGIFARHGLVREVFTQERLGTVRDAMSKVSDARRKGGSR